jgi:hypothetical protein
MELTHDDWIVTGVILLIIILTALVFMIQIILGTRRTSRKNTSEIKELKASSIAHEKREKERLESYSNEIKLIVSNNEEKTEERLANIESSINNTNNSIKDLQKYIIDIYREGK